LRFGQRVINSKPKKGFFASFWGKLFSNKTSDKPFIYIMDDDYPIPRIKAFSIPH
jgi:hypothetical protein